MKLILALLLSLMSLQASAVNPLRAVFIAGDTTASSYGAERAPRMDWGQVLHSYLGKL